LKWLAGLDLYGCLRGAVDEELQRRTNAAGNGNGGDDLTHKERVREAAERAAIKEGAEVDAQVALEIIATGFREARAAQGEAWQQPEVRKLVEGARDWLDFAVYRFGVRSRVNQEQEQGGREEQFTTLRERVAGLMRGAGVS
jgi:hypothetical protein